MEEPRETSHVKNNEIYAYNWNQACPIVIQKAERACQCRRKSCSQKPENKMGREGPDTQLRQTIISLKINEYWRVVLTPLI